MNSRRDLVFGTILLVVTFAVFRISPVRMIYDSRFEMLFVEQLLRHGTFSVEAHAIAELQQHQPGQIHQCCDDLPYQLVQSGERFYYLYPPGNVLLSLPFVALANAMGISTRDHNGVYDLTSDTTIQANLASALMAGFTVVVYLTSRMFLSTWWSLLLAAAAAFATPIWSNASRAMWSHTWGVFILGLVVWFIVRSETRRTRFPPLLVATLLAWLYFVRPAFVISIIAVAFYVMLYQRRILFPFLLTGVAWLALFIGYSEYQYGHALPPYYRAGGFNFTSSTFWQGFVGTLVSPSRGLLIYMPGLFFIAYLLVRYRSAARGRLVLMATAIACVHTLMLCFFVAWHGGYSYGPRYSTDIIPWFALLAILAVESRLCFAQTSPPAISRSTSRIEKTVAVLVVSIGVALHAVGGLSNNTVLWNVAVFKADKDFSGLWDWKHPQFLGLPPEWGERAVP